MCSKGHFLCWRSNDFSVSRTVNRCYLFCVTCSVACSCFQHTTWTVDKASSVWLPWCEDEKLREANVTMGWTPLVTLLLENWDFGRPGQEPLANMSGIGGKPREETDLQHDKLITSVFSSCCRSRWGVCAELHRRVPPLNNHCEPRSTVNNMNQHCQWPV